MTFAVEEYDDDDRAVARLAWLAQDDQAALDQACDVCLSYTDVDLGIRGRAIGLLARVLYGDPPSDSAAQQREHRRQLANAHGKEPDGHGPPTPSPFSSPPTSSVLAVGLPLSQQLLGGLGLALQPGQARLLVHASDLLTSRQPLAGDGDELAVGR